MQRLQRQDFSFTSEVILEAPPTVDLHLSADSSPPAKAAIEKVSRTVNMMEVKVDMPADGLLVVADNYCRGWEVVPHADSTQQNYRIQPADYILRAIPLKQGKHHFTMKFRPPGWTMAPWISLTTLAGFLLMVILPGARSLLIRKFS